MKKHNLSITTVAVFFLLTGCGRIVETRSSATKGSSTEPVLSAAGVGDAALGCNYIGRYNHKQTFCRLSEDTWRTEDQICSDGCNEGICLLENGVPTLTISSTRACIEP
jgi:hypothetical protein